MAWSLVRCQGLGEMQVDCAGPPRAGEDGVIREMRVEKKFIKRLFCCGPARLHGINLEGHHAVRQTADVTKRNVADAWVDIFERLGEVRQMAGIRRVADLHGFIQVVFVAHQYDCERK